jgi:succinate dehydrogenase / fumarate reductase cytochrome b subunit
MAFTGFIWFGFLLGHVLGNLKAFQGADVFNAYAHHLRIIGEPILPEKGFLWLFRALMLVAFVIHVLLSWQTSTKSWAARDRKYKKKANQNFDFASAWMRWGGVLILLFLVFHILHMTTGTLHPDFVEGEAYHNLVTGLANPLIAGFYALVTVAILFHLYHGIWSMFQTLGANHPKYSAMRRPLAVTLSILIFLAFISIPVAVLTGTIS